VQVKPFLNFMSLLNFQSDKVALKLHLLLSVILGLPFLYFYYIDLWRLGRAGLIVYILFSQASLFILLCRKSLNQRRVLLIHIFSFLLGVGFIVLQVQITMAILSLVI
jgi:hypothetical protein